MKRRLLIGGAVLAVCSTLVVAQDAPESLLPPGFDNPAPAPTPAPVQVRPPVPAQTVAPTGPNAPPPVGTPVIQPLPTGPTAPSVPAGPIRLPAGLPSLDELEDLNIDQLDEALGLKPKFDIPAAARRSLSQVGVLAPSEGGLPTNSLARQPASIIRAALDGTKGPLVSRWGHILLRRALSSRLAAPEGMSPVEFAALRAKVLNNIGEHAVARALVQDVDTGNWDEALTDAGVDAYIGTADVIGACPAVRLQGSARAEDDPQWKLLQAICNAFAGEGARAGADLTRALRNEDAPEVDILLAQRYAGAAGRGRRAVNLEWEGVEAITPWRFALANALGAELPEALTDDLGPYYKRIWALSPAVGLEARLAGSQIAAREGLLSSEAMVDLYSQVYDANGGLGDASIVAARLREAYVGGDPALRLAAIRDVWGAADGATPDYSRQVLTAFAAARMPANEEYLDDASGLIASMLAAGLDRDAMQWGPILPQGSEGWAQLVLIQERRNSPVAASAVDIFIGDDETSESRRSQFLLAGLAGLGRIGSGAQSDFEGELAVDLGRQSNWARLISQAAEANNQPMVAFLAGLGMQGSSWDRMTARNLYLIVSALNRVGLSSEARLIAAEAIARA